MNSLLKIYNQDLRIPYLEERIEKLEQSILAGVLLDDVDSQEPVEIHSLYEKINKLTKFPFICQNDN